MRRASPRAMGWYLSRRIAVVAALLALIVLAPTFFAEGESSQLEESTADISFELEVRE